jgi:hypothetical protein
MDSVNYSMTVGMMIKRDQKQVEVFLRNLTDISEFLIGSSFNYDASFPICGFYLAGISPGETKVQRSNGGDQEVAT